MSGFRAHWDRSIAVAEDGERRPQDAVVKDRGQTAVWGGEKPGPLCFDAVHRSLLVRFPDAAEKIAAAVAEGEKITTLEPVLPYLDEEIWPTGSGGADFPSDDGYRYRPNWDCGKLSREKRPNWHAVASVLRKPWVADAAIGPTFNAAVNGAVYWKEFGAAESGGQVKPFAYRILPPHVVNRARRVESLPATAKIGEPITIRDGVSYLALRPLPTTDLGRDAEVMLEAGKQQTQAHLEQTNIQPALLVHANFYRRGQPMPADLLGKLKDARSGFVVEMGDEKEFGSFEKFQAHVRAAKLEAGDGLS